MKKGGRGREDNGKGTTKRVAGRTQRVLQLDAENWGRGLRKKDLGKGCANRGVAAESKLSEGHAQLANRSWQNCQ